MWGCSKLGIAAPVHAANARATGAKSASGEVATHARWAVEDIRLGIRANVIDLALLLPVTRWAAIDDVALPRARILVCHYDVASAGAFAFAAVRRAFGLRVTAGRKVGEVSLPIVVRASGGAIQVLDPEAVLCVRHFVRSRNLWAASKNLPTPRFQLGKLCDGWPRGCVGWGASAAAG